MVTPRRLPSESRGEIDMAKGYKNPQLDELVRAAEERPDQVEWTNSRGIKVVLKPIPPYLVQMATQSVERPQVPTYTVKTLGGAEETHFHDETSILQSSDEEKAQWEEYKRNLRIADEKATDVVLDIILLEGVDVKIQDEEALLRRMKVFKLHIPEDPDERSLLMRRAYLIGCKEDADSITTIVLALTGVSVKDLSVVRKSFPDQVESGS